MISQAPKPSIAERLGKTRERRPSGACSGSFRPIPATSLGAAFDHRGQYVAALGADLPTSCSSIR